MSSAFISRLQKVIRKVIELWVIIMVRHNLIITYDSFDVRQKRRSLSYLS